MPHIVHLLEATAGGTQRHVRELSATLDPKRFTQTLVLSPTRNPSHFGDGIAPHVRVITLPMARGISPARDFFALVKLVRLLRSLSPDILHAHSSKAGALGRLAAAHLRIPCVYTPHGLSFCDTTLTPFRRATYLRIEKFLARFTTAFVALSREEFYIARDTLRIPPARIWRIPNGTDTQAVDCNRTQSDAPDIAFVGRAAPQKGLDVFLRAVEILRAARPGLRVLAVTDAPDEVAAWREACRAAVFVMPSRWEAAPYTLLDAMAHGMAIAASRVGGVADLLRDNENALLVEPGNPAALAAACARLLDDAPLRARLAQQARHDARPLTPSGMAAQYEILYVRSQRPAG